MKLIVVSFLRFLVIIAALSLLLTGCYVSREHRLWDKRVKKNLPDAYFYQVLKDTNQQAGAKLRFNYPYVYVGSDGYFHAYSFDNLRLTSYNCLHCFNRISSGSL